MAGVFSSVDRNSATQQSGMQIPMLGSGGAPNTNLNTPEYYQQQRQDIAQPGISAGFQSDPTQRAAMAQQSGTLGSVGTGFPVAPGDPNAPGFNLGPAPDPAAIRRRLMGSIPGASDVAGLPYDAGFDTGVSNLYAAEMGKLAGYDQSQGDLTSAYEKNRGYTLQNQDTDMKNLMDRLAFQGILSSGITTDQRALLGQKYGAQLDKLASGQATSLRDLATQRLAAQSEYQTKLGDLESGYSANVAKWLQDQAAQQAAREQKQASDAANAALMQQLNQIQIQGNQQQQALMNQIAGQAGLPALPASNSAGPIDWAAVAKAVANGMNLPVGYGGSLQ